MGTRITVVGAGSTYTPGARRGIRTPALGPPPDRRARPARHRRRTARGRRRAGTPDARPTGLGRPRHPHRRSRRRPRRRRLRAPATAGRRPGGTARRRDTAAPLRRASARRRPGAGGFAKALRTVPRVLELAELTARRANKDAWIVDFTNPVGIVTQALIDDGHRALGLCNVAITLQRRLAATLRCRTGARPARARRAQPPELGAGGPGGRRGSPARPAR